MHDEVVPDTQRVAGADGVLNHPQEEGMAPIRSVGVGKVLPADTYVCESRAHKLLGIRNEQAAAAHLAHGSGNQIAEAELDVDVIRFQLGRERAAPVLQEGLAAAVGGQVRCRHPAGEGAHSQDEAALLAGNHVGGDNLGDLQCSQAVDRHDVLELAAGCVEEGDRDAVALTDVVDQDTNVQALDKLCESLVVLVCVLGEIHGQDLVLVPRPSQFQFPCQFLQLRFGSRDEDEVESLSAQLVGEFFAEPVGRASDDCPGALFTIFADLSRKQHTSVPLLHCTETEYRLHWCRRR